MYKYAYVYIIYTYMFIFMFTQIFTIYYVHYLFLIIETFIWNNQLNYKNLTFLPLIGIYSFS